MMPFRQLTLRSPLAPDEALAAIRRQMGRPGMFGMAIQDRDKPFRGELNGMNFWLRRNIRYRNSFLPTITGSLQPEQGGSLLELRARMPLPPLLLALFVIFLNWIIASVALWTSIDSWPIALLFFGAPLLFWLLMLAAFQFEVRKIRQVLCELLRATEA